MSAAEVQEVLWPLARSATQSVGVNPGLRDTGAIRFAFLWDYIFRGDEMFPLLQAGLAERYPGSAFVPYDVFGNIHGHDEQGVLARLPALLRAEGIDAVVVGVGA